MPAAAPSAPAWARHLPPGIDPGSVDLLADRSLPAAWAARWAGHSMQPVLLDAGTTSPRWVTAGELEERTRRAASRLAGAGLGPGMRLILSARSSTDLVVAHVAALRLGLTVIPVNAAYREPEVAHIVRDAEPAAAIIDDAERAHWCRRHGPPGLALTGPALGGLTGAPTDAPALDAALPTDPALICYTSGTTGRPKGAVITHGNLLASAQALLLAWRWEPDDRLVLALPLFHIHGLGVALHGTLLAGASVVLLPSFDPESVVDAAVAHQASLFFGVPTMWARLAGSPRLPELRRLRLCVSGSAPLPADLHRQVAERCGQVLLERYGMTETIMNVSNPYEGERRPGTVGFPLPGVEVRLAQPGEEGGAGRTAVSPSEPSGASDPPERSPEILVRGPNVFPGYWGRPDATRAAFDEGGWFRTGDLGRLDPDGYLRIVGRVKDLIITGGYNVYPREVEDVLRAHPAVLDVAVVGLPSAEWGEEVCAVVVAGDAVAADDLLTMAGRELASYKLPRRIRFVDQLPRNALGKVLAAELRRP